MVDNHTHDHYEVYGIAEEQHDHDGAYAEVSHDHPEYSDETHGHDYTDLWDAIQEVENGIDRLEEDTICETERKLEVLISILSEDPNLRIRLEKAFEKIG